MGAKTRQSNQSRTAAYASLILAATGLCSTVSAGPIEDLPPGHWLELPNSKLSSVDPCPNKNCSYSGNLGQQAVTDVWNGAAYDSVRDRYIAWGGGHAGYAGNEIYVFDVFGSQQWTRLTEPTTNVNCNFSTNAYPDGRPCSMHTYDWVDFHPGTNSFVLLGGASPYPQGGGGGRRPHMFSFDSNEWRAGPDRPTGLSLTGASSAYDSNRGVLWLLSSYGGSLTKFDLNANGGSGKWTEYSQFGIDIDAVSAIDPTRDLFVTLEGRSEKVVIVHDLSNPGAAGVEVSTTGDKTVQNKRAAGFEWDTATEQFVGWAGGANVYTLKPPAGDWRSGTWTWTKVSPAGANTVVPTSPNETGIYSKWRYIPSGNVFILVNRTTDNVFIYRLSEGAGSPPPPPPPPSGDTESPSVPQGLVAEAVSSSRVELNWQASADTQSGVAGYRVFRDGAELGTSTATTFVDDAVQAATTYGYRVTAFDGASPANESAQSAESSVTTPTAVDTEAPRLTSATTDGGAQEVLVRFSEQVEEIGAETTSNYGISGGVTVNVATLQSNGDTVRLDTSALSADVDYTLTVNNVFDRAVTPNEIAPDSQVSFRFEAGVIGSETAPVSYEWGKLREGEPVYVDRSWIYTTVPSQFGDLDYLRTANDDNTASGDPFVNFSVTEPVTIYVGYDQRNGTLPEWLQSWNAVGEELATGGSAGAIDVRLALYEQEFAAGVVELGGNEMGNSMYAVVVKPGGAGSGNSGGGGTPPPPTSADDSSGGGALVLETLLFGLLAGMSALGVRPSAARDV